MKIDVKFKKLDKRAIIPSYADNGSSGMDLYALDDVLIYGESRSLIPTGIAFEIPENNEIQIRPRSGHALVKGVTVLNTPGTIDASYRGEIKVILYNTTKENVYFSAGDKIAQAVLCPILKANLIEIEDLSETDRGDKGFGSTGG